MVNILLILLKTLAVLYLLIAIIIFVWSLFPTKEELPEEAKISWSEAFIASILWPVTMWICITTFANSL